MWVQGGCCVRMKKIWIKIHTYYKLNGTSYEGLVSHDVMHIQGKPGCTFIEPYHICRETLLENVTGKIFKFHTKHIG